MDFGIQKLLTKDMAMNRLMAVKNDKKLLNLKCYSPLLCLVFGF
jgi:hypothetical protein